ncbi:protein-tyrosine phosphatase [Paenibacillus sp. UNCCL117]|uniref:arsenate reductase/protein-tyrosine-phosphatase family protein n=1 Tax=unclassified Paenibacillus TaxID=185978 RepID=UPI00087F2956|nr:MULTISPECIES: low molecular weight protein arginine phosphatase [unclassified Paenibacillus]SDE33437.1 protein-tyrosine phosphatase [Paenibacillus sp. cl123]SFW64028.1 protein-tyrosine phosphatase [Paenibacillus sp. UNCCL117]
MKRILFVCTGNTCRSPMAEGLMRSIADRSGLTGLEVRSAGVAAYQGTPISDHAASVLQAKGCEPSAGSMLLSQHLIEWSDLVLTMTSSHKRHTIQLYPSAVEKVYTLKEYVNADPEGERRRAEWESLLSELQLKQALGEPISEEERRRLAALEQQQSSPDIADPYGGSIREYRRCADEIERCLLLLADKLKREG